jgi:hypothetical protein
MKDGKLMICGYKKIEKWDEQSRCESTTMNYNVIFDITQTKFQHWSDLVGGFIFVIAALGFFWFHWRSAKHTGWRSFSYSVFIALFLLVWSLLPIWGFFHSYNRGDCANHRCYCCSSVYSRQRKGVCLLVCQ